MRDTSIPISSGIPSRPGRLALLSAVDMRISDPEPGATGPRSRRSAASGTRDGAGARSALRTRAGRALAGAALLGLALLLVAPSSPAPIALGEVRTWMYQFQKMEERASVDLLAKSSYDLLVVEPVGTYRSARPAEMKAMLARLREPRPGRLILAYFDLAEADSHRSYWDSGWKAPSKDRRGIPDFLAAPDPDGWNDTYLVAYWDPRWQKLVRADVQAILSAGFDGLCLDWAGAWRDPAVASLARSAQVNPAGAMLDLVGLVRRDALAQNPKALLLLQNESGLIDAEPRIAGLVEGVLFESTWYAGKAELAWSDAGGGDRENRATDPRESTPGRLAQIAKWKALGKPVFTLDYCLKPEHAREVYERSKALGCVPLVSRSALDRLTETPPPWLQ